jgi:Domain of unknown function (DUF5666)
MNKIIGGIAVAVIVAGGASFFGGVTYEKHVSASNLASVGSQGFGRGGASSTFPGGGVGARGMGGGFAGRGAGGAGANGGFAGGEIIAKDASSITVSVQGGGSKIVLVSPSTAIMKTAAGSLADLAIGQSVTVMGTANADGSITAQSVQQRPTFMNGSSTAR